MRGLFGAITVLASMLYAGNVLAQASLGIHEGVDRLAEDGRLMDARPLAQLLQDIWGLNRRTGTATAAVASRRR